MKKKEGISAWERVEIARDPKRKTAIDYIDNIFDEFIELHGDRAYKDDKAIVCGLAKIENQVYTVIAEQKGRNTRENIERNFGMPNPESYRKAVRFMKQAEKFRKASNYIYRYKRCLSWNRSGTTWTTEKQLQDQCLRWQKSRCQ